MTQLSLPLLSPAKAAPQTTEASQAPALFRFRRTVSLSVRTFSVIWGQAIRSVRSKFDRLHLSYPLSPSLACTASRTIQADFLKRKPFHELHGSGYKFVG